MDTSWPPASGSRNSNTIIRKLAQYGPGKMEFSPNDNGRPGDGGSDYHSYGMAVDFYALNGSAQWHERMRDFAKWLYDNYSGYLLELIHTTPFATDNGFYVKRGQKVGQFFYGNPSDPSSTAGQHVDHVHVAMDKASANALIAKLGAKSTPATTTTSTASAGHMYLIDLASYQDGIDLAKVKAAGFGAVNVKLGQGGYYEWTEAGDYIRKARALGMRISTFYWIEGGSSGASQAQHCLALLRKHNGGYDDVVVQCDNEDSATWAVTRDFANTMKAALGRPIVMYTGDWWAQSHGPSWNVASLTPYLWAPPNRGYLSSYPGDSSSDWNAGYWGFSKLAIMQYAVSGIAGSGTGNVSKSYIKDMNAWAVLSGQSTGASWMSNASELAAALKDANVRKALCDAVWNTDNVVKSPVGNPDNLYWYASSILNNAYTKVDLAQKAAEAAAAKDGVTVSVDPEALKVALTEAVAEALSGLNLEVKKAA